MEEIQCPACKGTETRKTSVVDDVGTVEQLVCANKECGYVLREEQVIEREDGTEVRRPRSVKPESQPEGFSFGPDNKKPEEPILTAEQMMALAIETREKTIGEASRALAKDIVEACAEHVLEGEHDYLISDDDMPPGEVLQAAVQELKDRGYTVRKSAEPGKGTWVKVKWPTKRKKRRKTSKSKQEEPQVSVVAKKAPSKKQAMGEDPEVKKRQKSAAKRRKQILEGKSD